MNRALLEVAVDTFENAVRAESDGADRLELCSRLVVGGLTPTVELFERVRAAVRIPIVVMIRPRAGDFHFDVDELCLMGDSIRSFAPDGFVFGCLTESGDIDRVGCAELIAACGSTPAIFHRAWDERPRNKEELELLIDLGFRRLLTSGCAPSVPLGIDAIRDYHRQSAGRIEILPGAGLNPENLAEVATLSGCGQVHGTFRGAVRAVRTILDQFVAES